jgi:hypothetical protein
MLRALVVAIFLLSAFGADAQFITEDANALLHVYWTPSGIQDTKANTWTAEGSPSLASAEFGYSAGGEGFSTSDFWFNSALSAFDFTAVGCSTPPFVCGDPAFTAVLAFRTDSAVGTRFLLSDVTLGDGDGWYLSVSTPRKAQFRAFGLLDSSNVYATDTQGLDVGTGLQVICFGIDADLTPRLQANGRAMVSGSPGEYENVCSPPDPDPSCLAAFIPSYGDGFLGIHDGFNTAWRPAAWETFFEVYLTRTPITSALCESLEAEIRGE